MDYFGTLFRDPKTTDIVSQLRVVKHFPRFFTVEEGAYIGRLVILVEVEEVLKNFKKDKSHSPNGWTVEFYLHFFDLLGEEILEMIKETRTLGLVLGALNTTFLALIPKVDKVESFKDFRPISL